MLTAIDITAMTDYTLKSDKSPNPTIFKVGYMDLFLRAQLSKELADMRTAKGNAVFVVIKVIRFGLRGWNLKDKDGKQIPFTTIPEEIPGVGTYQAVSYEGLNHLQMAWVNELADQIMKLNYPMSGPVFDEVSFAAAHPDLYKDFLIGGDIEKNSPLPSLP